MASSNIKLFDENKGNMLSDSEFNISTQRLNGLQTGVASSQLQNKAMYQASLIAYAIAQVMMQNGLNANDTDAVSAFVANLSGTMLQKVYDIATTEEAQAGVATGKWMSPALVKAVIDKTLSDKNFLQKSGGTMTGNLILNANPTANLGAATKQYVDSAKSSLQTNINNVNTNLNNVDNNWQNALALQIQDTSNGIEKTITGDYACNVAAGSAFFTSKSHYDTFSFTAPTDMNLAFVADRQNYMNGEGAGGSGSGIYNKMKISLIINDSVVGTSVYTVDSYNEVYYLYGIRNFVDTFGTLVKKGQRAVIKREVDSSATATASGYVYSPGNKKISLNFRGYKVT